MSTLTHAQYNSPMPLYSRDNVQDVLNQVTGTPARPHSAMSGSSFDPSHSRVYRYLQTGNQLPAAHSVRYDDQSGADHPKYRGFVDPNVQSPSFKRLQYVTGSAESGAEDEISHEVQPPPRTHTETTVTSQQHSQSGQGQPIALGYAPISGGHQQQQQYTQQQHYQQQQQERDQQQYHQEQTTRTQFTEDLGGPAVAQRDPTADDADRDHPLDPTFAAKIAEAERPKVPATVAPSWARFAEKKQERWQQYTGGQSEAHHQSQPQPPPRTAQHYRPPQSHSPYEPSYTLDASRAAQDKWQAHYAPYRFEAGTTAASQQERPRSRSVGPEPAYVPGRRYGGHKEWMKPFIAPNIRYNYGDGFAPPAQPSYSPLSSGRPYNISSTTTAQDYGLYGGQTGAGISPNYGQTYGGTQNQTYSSLLSSSNQQQSQQNQYGTSGYTPSHNQQGTRTSSTYDYTSSSVQGGTYGGTGAPQPVAPPSAPSLSKDSQYSRTVYESRKEGSTSGSQQQKQVVAAPWTGSQSQRTDSQSQSLWQSETEARRQRQLMEQEVLKRAATSGGRQADTITTVSTRPASHDNRVSTTYTTTTGGGSGGAPVGPKWQQAPGSETKTQSTGSYLDPQGNTVNYTKEVYTSSDPGKEFSMLTEQEKKIMEEPLQPGVVSRHITTKYYKKSTFTSSTTTSTSQTPPVTSTVTRQAITSGPSQGRRF